MAAQVVLAVLNFGWFSFSADFDDIAFNVISLPGLTIMHVSKRYALSTLTYKISRLADDASYNGSTIELPSPCYTGSMCNSPETSFFFRKRNLQVNQLTQSKTSLRGEGREGNLI